MGVDVARKLVEILDSKVVEHLLGNPFLRSDYKTYPLDAKNFKPITLMFSEGKIAFVDGGNHEILHAPNFSVQINRIYHNIFREGLRRTLGDLPIRIEFFSATYSDFHSDQLFFKTLTFPIREEHRKYLPEEKDLIFNSADRTLTTGLQRADISRVASLSRRFAEWEFASHIVSKELDEDDILVVDGTLQAPHTNEGKYVEKIQKHALKKGVYFTGLSKACELHTTTGLSLIGAIRKLAMDNGISGMWYFPIASISSPDHKAIMLAVKLHPKADRVFRFEVFAEEPSIGDERVEKVLQQLSSNASDISFPGYPYGLIDADMFARVREDEVERYQMMLFSEISKQGKWEKFLRHIQATDTHDILNMLMG